MMRSLLLIAAVLVAGAMALKDGQKCEPGSNFKMDCNTCRCSADGSQVSCTRKFCVPEVQSDEPKAQPAEPVSSATDEAPSAVEKDEEQVQTNGKVCEPNEVKMEDCNRCKCAANGIGWFCTRKACPPREKRAAPSGEVAAPKYQECVPGTNFKSADGCNNCFCTETGIAACTQMFCFNNKVKRDAPPPKQECAPGTNFKSADGCNDCFCTENGIAACTMKFCYTEKVKREAPGQQECTPGSSFKDADGCNTCFCSPTGHVACTKRYCVPKVKRETPPPKRCEPGTRFMDDEGCNECYCTPSGQPACTEKLCIKGKSKREAPKSHYQCEPGSNFKSADGCNDCFCTASGIAACTMKFCFNDKVQDKVKRQAPAVEEQLPQSKLAPWEEGFECAPNKSFKFQCNTCRCDATGKQAACTYKFCIPGEY